MAAAQDADKLSIRRLRRSIAVTLLSGASVSVLLVSALYTDVASLPGNAITIGTVDIASSPTSAALTSGALIPGSSITSTLQVLNSGTLALRYAIRSTTTENVLAAALDLTIKSGVTACTNAGYASTGTVIYGPGDLGNTTGITLVGDATQGAQTGDRDLAASTSEILCLHVTLPLNASASAQNVTTTATISLVAEQTANN